MHDDLRSAIDRHLDETLDALRALVGIPSISASPDHAGDVRHSAHAVGDLLRARGFRGVRLLEIDGAHPAVFGEIPGPSGAPTVLLYAHHDVQPPGPGWTVDPFQPTERDGRLYGRGSADDKAGILMHLAAVQAHDGVPPVGVKVFVEGEEEIGSRHLAGFLAAYGAELAADVIVIGDSGNWRVGTPSLTTSLRGLVDCVVEVRTLDAAVHSGMFGGVFPDALTALVRLLATLHDPAGRVAVPGLVARPAPALDLSEQELRQQAGVRPGVELIGEGTLTSRTWTRPAISVLGIDAPTVDGAANALVPSARAKVSMRIAPGQDPEAALQALTDHLRANVPWGAELDITPGSTGEAFSLDTEGPGYAAYRAAFAEAFGRDCVEIGVGGSIPFVAAFADRYPDADILLVGVADPTSGMHGPDESVDLGDLRRAALAEAIALRLLGGGTGLGR